MEQKYCGMQVCKKCGAVNVIAGALILIAALGLWDGAPAWFNAWAFVGVYLLLWGIMAVAGKQH